MTILTLAADPFVSRECGKATAKEGNQQPRMKGDTQPGVCVWLGFRAEQKKDDAFDINHTTQEKETDMKENTTTLVDTPRRGGRESGTGKEASGRSRKTTRMNGMT